MIGALGGHVIAYRVLDLLGSGRYPFESLPASAWDSKTQRSCWLPWPVNATVSRQYTECSHHDQ